MNLRPLRPECVSGLVKGLFTLQLLRPGVPPASCSTGAGDNQVTGDLGTRPTFSYRPVGPCEHPRSVVDDTTGEVFTVRCGSRLVRQCRSCSALAKKDYQKLIAGGFLDVDPRQFSFFFLTLTAPSFGATHRVPKVGRPVQRCQCGVMHDPVADSGLRGVPIDPDTYDYDGCVAWNYSLGRLWDATRASLSAMYPGTSYAKVVEFQARGALHLHALLRVPVALHITYTSARGRFTGCDALLEVARTTATRSGMRWGREGDCRTIRQVGRRDKSVYYMAKMLTYVTKDAEGDVGSLFAAARDHYRRLDTAARNMRCDGCLHLDEPCGALPHRRWGARSSVLSKSRESRTHLAWSALRRLDLRARRAEFARQAERLKVALDTFARLAAGGLGAGGYSPVMRV